MGGEHDAEMAGLGNRREGFDRGWRDLGEEACPAGALTGKATYGAAGELVAVTPANAIIGHGRIDGRKVSVEADDFTIRSGSSESIISEKWLFAERMALELKMPLIRLVDTAGGSIRLLEQQQQTKIPGYPTWPVFQLLGSVPVVGVALGACAGLGAIKIAISHFSVMVREKSQVFAAGPPVVKQGLNQDVTKEELGGYKIHSRQSGAVDNEAENEEEALAEVRRFLSYLPRNIWELPTRSPPQDDPERREDMLNDSIPRDRRKVYNVRRLRAAVLDKGSIFEIGRNHGGSTVAALCRIDGYAVGVMANDPLVAGGAMTRAAAQGDRKALRTPGIAFSLGRAIQRPGRHRSARHAPDPLRLGRRRL